MRVWASSFWIGCRSISWSRQEVTDIYWLLGSLLEPPVAQEWSGTMIYDVRYDGQGYTADTRTALTPEGLDMHNDSSMGEAPANYLSSPVPADGARSGGKSSLSSAYAAHNHFLTQASRSAASVCISRSIATSRNTRHLMLKIGIRSSRSRTVGSGSVSTRGSSGGAIRRPVRRWTMPGRKRSAILNSFLTDPAHRHDFWMERGQVQILNNRIIVHGRTPYEDHRGAGETSASATVMAACR